MRSGIIVQIRVSPKDCMAVVDVLRTLQLDTRNLSFPQAVKIAFASAMESLRQQGIIPNREGFEFEEMLAPFRQQLSLRAAKLKVTNLMAAPEYIIPPIMEESVERKRRRLRYEELIIKKNADPLNFGLQDQEELRPLLEEFYS